MSGDVVMIVTWYYNRESVCMYRIPSAKVTLLPEVTADTIRNGELYEFLAGSDCSEIKEGETMTGSFTFRSVVLDDS